jgi:hypothetical protein
MAWFPASFLGSRKKRKKEKGVQLRLVQGGHAVLRGNLILFSLFRLSRLKSQAQKNAASLLAAPLLKRDGCL